MAEAINDSKKQGYVLVEFTLDGDVYRFTNWATTIDPAGANWLSVPTLDVKWPPNTGTFNSTPCVITIDRTANASIGALADILVSDGAPTAPVEVKIHEVTKSVVLGGTGEQRTPFRGRVQKSVANAGGRANQVRFEALAVKSRLEIPLGLPCNHHCPWQFMGRGCSVQGGGAAARGPQQNLVQKARTLVSIDGKRIVISPTIAFDVGTGLRFGYIEFRDVRIGIRDWGDPGNGTLILDLRQQPPGAWVGQTINVVPGCDKTLTNCKAWDNEEHFGGAGYNIPAYNPHFEEGNDYAGGDE